MDEICVAVLLLLILYLHFSKNKKMKSRTMVTEAASARLTTNPVTTKTTKRRPAEDPAPPVKLEFLKPLFSSSPVSLPWREGKNLIHQHNASHTQRLMETEKKWLFNYKQPTLSKDQFLKNCNL